MFVVIVKYVKPLEAVDSVLAEHRKFLEKYFAQKKLVGCGRQNPRVGGVIIFRAESREGVWGLVREDPFYKSGVAEYEVIEFVPSLWESAIGL